jgi:hypothetical protein
VGVAAALDGVVGVAPDGVGVVIAYDGAWVELETFSDPDAHPAMIRPRRESKKESRRIAGVLANRLD